MCGWACRVWLGVCVCGVCVGVCVCVWVGGCECVQRGPMRVGRGGEKTIRRFVCSELGLP